jgi:hypothetical protein
LFEIERRHEIPRMAEGKYLKLLCSHHEEMGTLNASKISKLWPNCDMAKKRPEKEKLTVKN